MSRRKKAQARPEELLEFYVTTLKVDQAAAAELRLCFNGFQAELGEVARARPMHEAIKELVKTRQPFHQQKSGDVKKIVFFAVLAQSLKLTVPRRFEDEASFKKEMEQFKLFEGREGRELTQLFRFGNWMDLGLQLVSAVSNKSFLSALAGLLSDGTIPDRRFARGGGSNIHVLERDFIYHYLSKIPFEPRYRHAMKPTKRVRPQRELFKDACALLKTFLLNDGGAASASADSDAACSEGEDDEIISTTISTTTERSSSIAAPPQVFSVPTTSRELAVFDGHTRSKRPCPQPLTSTLPQSNRVLDESLRQPKGMMWDLENSNFLSEFDSDFYGPPFLHMTPQLADSIQTRLMQRATETSAMLNRLTESPTSSKVRKVAGQRTPATEFKVEPISNGLPEVSVPWSAPPQIEFAKLEGFGGEDPVECAFPRMVAVSSASASASARPAAQDCFQVNWDADCLDEQLSSFYSL